VTLIAVFVNMVTKVALAFTAGRREYAVTLGLASAVAILLGAIGYLSTRGLWVA